MVRELTRVRVRTGPCVQKSSSDLKAVFRTPIVNLPARQTLGKFVLRKNTVHESFLQSWKCSIFTVQYDGL